jgi:hypothetical protein
LGKNTNERVPAHDVGFSVTDESTVHGLTGEIPKLLAGFCAVMIHLAGMILPCMVGRRWGTHPFVAWTICVVRIIPFGVIT